MRTEDFDFDLPRELVAQRPVRPRDGARLLEVGESLTDRTVRDLPEVLRPGDLAVFNDTRVIPTRLYGLRDSVRVEVTLHKPEGHKPEGRDDHVWRAFARPGKRLREGDRIVFGGGELSAEVREKREGGEIVLAFDAEGAALLAALERIGAMPLPPYIHREDASDPHDREDYQTIFAREPGAVAAPTAGLHFTERLLAALDARGVRRTTVTLHVGAGTFLPVKTEDPREHKIHSEAGVVTPETAAEINATRAAGGRVAAIGTTALRLIETAAGADGRVHPFAGESEIFILPGYRFKAVDLLFTNFHLPRSTLFMLVCAFAGTDRMRQAYEHAKQAGYRFYSYGDASLLHRDESA